MKLGIAMVILAALQAAETDNPKSLRGNELYSKTTFVMARDICSDHPSDTRIWVINYLTKTWMNPTCGQWKEADSK